MTSMNSEPTDRAVLLLQHARDLLFESRSMGQQLERTPDRESAASGSDLRRVVAALEEGLVTTLQHAMDVLRRFSVPPVS